MKERLLQPTEITYPPSKCPVDAINIVLKLDLGQRGWLFDEDPLLRPSQMRHLEVNGKVVAMFIGHSRELPGRGGNDERVLFIGQKEWEKLPLALKEIFLDPKYRVEVYFV